MQRRCFSLVAAILLVAGCAGIVAEQARVSGAGPDDLLKLRAGPGLGFRVIAGLPDGTVLNRYDCVTELGQRWCAVALPDAPRLRGYVSADYLTATN